MKIIHIDRSHLIQKRIKSIAHEHLPGSEYSGFDSFESFLDVEVKDNHQESIILIDLQTLGSNCSEAVRRIQLHCPDCRIAVLSETEDQAKILHCLNQGVSGFILKSSDTDIIVSALHILSNGGIYFPPVLSLDSVRESAGDSVNSVHITPRQKDVLNLVAKGLSNKDIANELGLSESTVKLHVTSIMKSLGVSNRYQAVLRAKETGLIDAL